MSSRDDANLGVTPPNYGLNYSYDPPTFAAFSPVTLSATTPSRSSRRSTILVHQKSPLLLATPPQVTRALAYSHPFILPLNTFVGLLTWSTGDPWQSFLLLCAFWAVVLYGDTVVRWSGPVVVGVGLIAGMYGRRYSPLSSSGWNEPARDSKDAAATSMNGGANGAAHSRAGKAGAQDQKKHIRGNSEVTNTKHQKTLDEIVETLKELTGRCNVLMEPLLEMTDFLSTQRTPTSATVKPALTAMFMRLLIVTPFWVILAMPPWRVVTTRRVILVAGSLILTWHARVMRVSRTILWRSAAVRALASAITGLHFDRPVRAQATATNTTNNKDLLSPDGKHGRVQRIQAESELTKGLRKSSFHHNNRAGKSSGVKFTFIIYENQRRWVGLGWTNNVFAYERPAWSDEHNNAVPSKDEFELPAVEDGSGMQWRWASGSRWRVDGVHDEQATVDYDGQEGKNGWVYYDTKVSIPPPTILSARHLLPLEQWQNGKRGQDGWGRWTRRRKWYRDAELVEVEEPKAHELDGSTIKPKSSTSTLHTKYSTMDEKMISHMRSEPAVPIIDHTPAESHHDHDSNDGMSTYSSSSKSFWPSLRRRNTERSSILTQAEANSKQRGRSTSDVLSEEEDVSGLGFEVEMELQKQGKGGGGDWGIGDEARMNLE